MTREMQGTRKQERALARVLEGQAGIEQSASVRSQLRALERAGLVRYLRGGWYLTDDGRRALRADGGAR